MDYLHINSDTRRFIKYFLSLLENIMIDLVSNREFMRAVKPSREFKIFFKCLFKLKKFVFR